VVDCAASHLEPKGGGRWSGVFTLPAGTYGFKIAHDDAWTENYGAGGAANGDNIPLVVAKPMELQFTYDERDARRRGRAYRSDSAAAGG
jgi:hypothetical protein